MNTNSFFNTYPKALEVLKVGEMLFLPAFKKDAELLASRKGVSVEVISRPKQKRDTTNIIQDGSK